jgi:hypothetical protein
MGLMDGDVTIWYQSQGFNAKPRGPNKWSLDPSFREEIMSRGLILNLRMFLSANMLLGHVRRLGEVAVE